MNKIHIIISFCIRKPLSSINQSHNAIRKLSYKSMLTWYSGLVKPKLSNPPYDHLIQIGDPRLREISKPVLYDEIESEHVQRLIHHLRKTFKAFNCIGLSAPQVGINVRIFMIGVDKKALSLYTLKEQKMKEISLVEEMVIVNPEIQISHYKKLAFSESCGSVRGFCADVPRYHSLKLKGFSDLAEPIELSLSGFTARIIQHEIDHLNGKLYTDIMDRKSLHCSHWQIINERNGKIELPYGPL